MRPERTPHNHALLLARINEIGRTHPRRDQIAQAFERDETRAAALCAVVREEMEAELGKPVEWWTTEELCEWLERGARRMNEAVS